VIDRQPALGAHRIPMARLLAHRAREEASDTRAMLASVPPTAKKASRFIETAAPAAAAVRAERSRKEPTEVERALADNQVDDLIDAFLQARQAPLDLGGLFARTLGADGGRRRRGCLDETGGLLGRRRHRGQHGTRVGGFFTGSVSEQSGHGNTVRAESGLPVDHGAALRMVVELSTPPRARFTIDTACRRASPTAEAFTL
jgi:hypothetical protein